MNEQPVARPWFCPQCGSPNISAASFCTQCGGTNPLKIGAQRAYPPQQQAPPYPQYHQPPPQPQMQQYIVPAVMQQPMVFQAIGYPAKSRAMYVILGLLLGGLGVHNFYAGRTGPAVAQLLITLLLFWLIFPIIAIWIWVIIELITVDTDGRGVKMS